MSQQIKKQQGLGLIELLISLLIGAIVLVGIVQLYSASAKTAVVTAASSRIQHNVAFAFSRLEEDIAQSGNLGCMSMSINDNNAFSSTPVTSLLAPAADTTTIDNNFSNFTQLVGGKAVSTPLVTDTFSVRYVNHVTRINYQSHTQNSVTVDDEDDNYQNLRRGQVVMLSNCSRGVVFMITNDPKDSDGVLEHDAITLGQLRNSSNNNLLGSLSLANDGITSASSPAYLYAGNTGAYEYYIDTSVAARNRTETCDIASPGNCSLYRRHNNQMAEIVEGVHGMDIRYGWTDGDQLFFKETGNVASNDWPKVDRVEISLQFNSIDYAKARTASEDTFDRDEVIERTVKRVFNLPNQL